METTSIETVWTVGYIHHTGHFNALTDTCTSYDRALTHFYEIKHTRPEYGELLIREKTETTTTRYANRTPQENDR